MKKLYLLTAAAVLLTGCGAVGGDNEDSTAGTTAMTAPDTDGKTPCVLVDSDNSIITSDGRITESFVYYFPDENTIAVDVTVTNHGEHSVTLDCRPHIWAETDLTEEALNIAWTMEFSPTTIPAGESTVMTAEFDLLEEGWSEVYAHVNLRAQLETDGGYYDPSSVTIDFTAPAEGV